MTTVPIADFRAAEATIIEMRNELRTTWDALLRIRAALPPTDPDALAQWRHRHGIDLPKTDMRPQDQVTRAVHAVHSNILAILADHAAASQPRPADSETLGDPHSRVTGNAVEEIEALRRQRDSAHDAARVEREQAHAEIGRLTRELAEARTTIRTLVNQERAAAREEIRQLRSRLEALIASTVVGEEECSCDGCADCTWVPRLRHVLDMTGRPTAHAQGGDAPVHAAADGTARPGAELDTPDAAEGDSGGRAPKPPQLSDAERHTLILHTEHALRHATVDPYSDPCEHAAAVVDAILPHLGERITPTQRQVLAAARAWVDMYPYPDDEDDPIDSTERELIAAVAAMDADEQEARRG